MPLKRRPPEGNVRRIQYIDGNLRYTLTNKSDRIVQSESTHEYKLTLLLDFDTTVSDYASQPETFEWVDSNGKQRRYTPDYIVWRTDGSVEIHEVTISERRASEARIKEREAIAKELCANRNWTYIVHTEEILPSATEFTNLQALKMFAPTSLADRDCINAIEQCFESKVTIRALDLIADCTKHSDIPSNLVRTTIAHMLWHQMLHTNMRQLIFDQFEYLPNVVLWMGVSEE